MTEQFPMNEAERNLFSELLQRELDELPVEIHHTRSSQMRDDLSRRREMVRELLTRLRSVVVV